MTCEDAIALLVDYLEATLTPDVAQALEAHLADCDPCRAYLATYRRTVSAVGGAGRVEMPAELRRRLRALLLTRLGGR
jgi:anti-sigma factor RsiW